MMATSSDVVFQVSDLARKRTDIVDAARAGGARVRDKDGTSLVMLPERRLHLLEQLAFWSGAHLRLEELLRRYAGVPSVTDLGQFAWLRVFDRDDIREFLDELQAALVVAYADEDISGLEECVESWRITARQVEDPLRRRTLTKSPADLDLLEAARPGGPPPDREDEDVEGI